MSQSKQETSIIDLLIPLISLGLITLGIGDYGLYEPHESHFALVASEMVWRNDWVTPHLNGAPYLNKPPLLYWLIALSQIIFTNTEFASRLPIALAAWIATIIAGKWSKDLWGVTASRCTTLMLATTLGWFIFSHQILIDVLLGTILLASSYSLWKLVHKSFSWLYFVIFYGSVALCFLTKGLIGIFMIAFSYLAITAFNYKTSNILRKTRLYLGIFLVLALIISWGWYIEKANPGFWHYFIFNEHLARIFNRRVPADYVVSQTSILGYLGYFALWCFPWIILIPNVVLFSWQKINTFKTNRDRKLRTAEQNAVLLLTVGCLLPILVFLPLKSRLIYYSIPAVPSYIILCGGFCKSLVAKKSLAPRSFRQSFRQHRSQNTIFSGIYGALFIIGGILGATAIALMPTILERWNLIEQNPIFTSLIMTVTIVLALGFLFTGTEVFQRNYLLAFNCLFVCLLVLYSVFPTGFAIYQNLRSSKNLIAIAEKPFSIDALWIFEGSREIGAAGGLSYYLNKSRQNFQVPPEQESLLENLPGIVKGKKNTFYRNVLVLEDSGLNRLPPEFPGDKPNYLINQQQLQEYWNGDRLVVFVTDFLRDPQDEKDPVSLNLPQNVGQPSLRLGNRILYINANRRN